MVRRTTRTLAIVVTLLLAWPAAASAYSRSVVSDGVTATSDQLLIRVGFDTRETQPDRLLVRIAGEDRDRVRADCVQNCNTQAFGGSSVFALPISARGGPFGSPTNRVANGDLTLDIVGSAPRPFGQPRVEFPVGTTGTTIDVPGSAVSGLKATAADREVQLSWTRAPEAGISGYKIERITGSRTTQVATASSSASSATDRPGPGEHRYRVTTLRPRAGGSGTHETVSSTVSAVIEPEPEPEPETPADESDASNGSDGEASSERGSDRNGSSSNGSRSSGSSNVDASADESDDAAEAPSTAGPQSETRERRAPRTASLPNVSTGRSGLSIPELPRVGDIFRSELDFDGDGARSADGDEVVLSAPAGGSGGFLGGGEEAERIAIPIAGGLLLTAIGLHLWRWLKVPLT